MINNRAIFDSNGQANFVHAPLALHDIAAQERIDASLIRDISASRPASAFTVFRRKAIDCTSMSASSTNLASMDLH